MPFYSGGNFRTTFTCATGTRQEIVTGAETALSANGWTVISGGGTGNVVLQSATPPGGSAIRLRAYDPGSGTSAQFFIQNQAGGNQSQTFWLYPEAGDTFSVWGCQYQVFVFRGDAATVPRKYFACGALYVPNWLRSSVTEALWANSSACHDSYNNLGASFRKWATVASGRSNAGPQYLNWTGIVNNLKIDRNVGSNSAICDMQLAAAAGAWTANDSLSGGISGARRFHDNTAFQVDAWMAFGLSSATDEPKYRGALWDAVVVSDTFSGGTAKTIDGHTFYALTDSCPVNAGGCCIACATLFVL